MDDESNSISIMVLEDNYIVGADIVSILKDNGYTNTHLVSNSDAALRLIESGQVQAAIVDLVLGAGATSKSVGLALKTNEIPFFFLTGYTKQAHSIDPELSDIHIQSKPYQARDIIASLRVALGSFV